GRRAGRGPAGGAGMTTAADRIRQKEQQRAAQGNGRARRRPAEESEQEAPPGSWTWQPVSSPDFFAADFRPTWLVKRLLVKGQPAVIGGPMKTMKTTVGLDLAVSLASGTPFLGFLDVYQAVRVAVLSGES